MYVCIFFPGGELVAGLAGSRLKAAQLGSGGSEEVDNHVVAVVIFVFLPFPFIKLGVEVQSPWRRALHIQGLGLLCGWL